MKKGWKITLGVLGVLLVLLLIGPFVVPIPPLEGTQAPETLAGPESQFIEINNLNIHYLEAGTGTPVFILLHGFGASTFSWREVIEPLAEHGRVIAYDRPAFGLTERPLSWEGDNPYTQESNIRFLLGLMNALEIEQAVLVGNSAGGTLATAFTLAHPNRVQGLVQVNAAIYQTRPDSPLLNWLFQTPQMNRIGPLVARQLAGGQGDAFIESAWYDPSPLENKPEIIEGYRKPLQVNNWDRALWEHTKATRAPNLAENLTAIQVATLVIAGRYDQIVPLESSLQLAEDIPGADLVVLDQCGHLPQEECPTPFTDALLLFTNQLLEENTHAE